MARRLKVFGGLSFSSSSGKQVRTTVTAYSQKDAVMFLGLAGAAHVSLHEFRGYWGETGNKKELSDANNVVGRVTVYEKSVSVDSKIAWQKDVKAQ